MITIFDLFSKVIYVKKHVPITWIYIFIFFLAKSLLAIDHTGEVLIYFRINLAKPDVKVVIVYKSGY